MSVGRKTSVSGSLGEKSRIDRSNNDKDKGGEERHKVTLWPRVDSPPISSRSIVPRVLETLPTASTFSRFSHLPELLELLPPLGFLHPWFLDRVVLAVYTAS